MAETQGGAQSGWDAPGAATAKTELAVVASAGPFPLASVPNPDCKPSRTTPRWDGPWPFHHAMEFPKPPPFSELL